MSILYTDGLLNNTLDIPAFPRKLRSILDTLMLLLQKLLAKYLLELKSSLGRDSRAAVKG